MAATAAQEIPKIFTLEQIEKVTNTESFQNDLIQTISDGFVEFDKGSFFAAPIQTLGAPPMAPFCQTENYAAQTCVKSGYFRDNPYYVIKVASGGHPQENSGLMQVYSQATGRMLALLLDEGILTELRTAAVGALVAKLLAPKDIQCIGILGTGVQARYQLKLLKNVTDCRNVLVWGRTKEKVEMYKEEMAKEGWKVEVANEPDDLLGDCNLIVTTTCAREPVLGNSGKLPSKRTLITCIGADAPGKTELNMNLIQNAALRVADNPEQSKERGEFQAWGRLQGSEDPIALGSLLGATEMRRRSKNDDRLMIFDSSGVALQDCVVAQMVYEALNDEVCLA